MRTLAFGALATLSLLLLPTLSTALSPGHFWSRSAGGPSAEAINSVAVVSGSSDVVVTGYYNGTLNLGSGDMTTIDISNNGFVARYNKRGELKWAKSFGSYNSDAGTSVAVDATGNVYLAGVFSNTVNLGGSDLFSVGSQDFFIAKLDPNGAHIWSYSYGGVQYDQSTTLNVDATGNAYLTGYFMDSVSFGGPPAVAVAQDAFIARYNSNGAWQWNVAGTGAGDAIGYSITSDATGNVYATGFFSTSVTFAPNPALVSDGGLDVYIVKYSSAGTLQWSQRRGGTEDDLSVAIASDASGNIVVGGGFSGTANFGGSNLTSSGSFDIFLAKYNTSGVHQWSNRYGGGEIDLIQGLCVLGSGSILATGYIGPNTNLGGGVLPVAGDKDIFLAKFSSGGGYVWDRSFGGDQDDRAASIGADLAGNAFIGGFFQTVMNPGGGQVHSNGQGDLFLAKYGTGEPAISTIKDIGNDQGRSVRITVTRSLMDDGTAELPITEYQAFRRVLPLPAALSMKGGAAVPPGTWEYAASVPASNAGTYRIVAPTLADSSIADGMYRTKFFVRAATSNPSVFFDSPVDSGYSLDNLAPGAPANLTITAGLLEWDESPSTDFDYFSVYGSPSNSFGAGTLIDYTVAPALDVSSAVYNYYFVTATDFSGNEGKPSSVSYLSGLGNTHRYVLSVSASPNPFNPSTTVRYTVPARGHVDLGVYDLRGGRVASLVDREHDAGAYTTTWNGTDTSGQPVASGVYFARLLSPAGVRSYKLVLLK